MSLSHLISEEVFEKSPAFIAVLLGDNFVFNKVNPRYLEITGNRDIIGKPVMEALPELEGQGFLELLQKVYTTGETFEGKEIPAQLLAAGSTEPRKLFLNFIYQRLTDEYSNPIGIYVFGVDVTDQVKARILIEESENQFRQFMDTMPQMAFIANQTGDITYFNKPWYEYTKGIEGTEGWGWKDQPIHHPDDLDLAIKRWTHSVKTGEPYEIEYRLRRYDGVYRWHLGRATAMRDKDGHITRWIGTNTDIHDNKEIEARLSESVKSRDEFLSIASHELKTPLTTLRLQNQIFKRAALKGHTNIFEKQNVIDMVDQNERQVIRLTRLVDDMLDVSRIRFNKLTTKIENVDLSALVNDFMNRMKPQFEQKKYQAPILDIEENISCSIDRLRIEQVLSNLVTNAIRYGNQKQISVSLKRTDTEIKLSVTDHGIGINPENITRIFDKFERAIDANEVSGLGLGLYISKKIMEEHHGDLTVQSWPDEGSIFTVHLPTGATNA